MRILFLGDVFGAPGRAALAAELPKLKAAHRPDLTVANAENTSHGKGLTPAHKRALRAAGVDFFTMGNHTWAKREIFQIIDSPDLVRPLNIRPDHPYAQAGAGTRAVSVRGVSVRITNLLGLSVGCTDKFTVNPFVALDEVLKQSREAVHLVDFHAETTSEKNAFGIYFDGRVSAVFGTHTHVPTNDLRVTPKGTAYLTDAGMCGPGFGSVIGATPEAALPQFVPPLGRFRMEVAREAGWQVNGVLFDVDEASGRATACKQIRVVSDDPRYRDWRYRPRPAEK